MKGGLAKFARRLERSDEALLAAAQAIRKEFLILIDEGFRHKIDPIGRKWAKRKAWYDEYLRRGGKPYPLMNKTLTLRQGFYVTTPSKRNGYKVKIGNDAPYTRWHQDSTRRMVARKMVPDRRLSPKWRARINKKLPEALAEHFRKRG